MDPLHVRANLSLALIEYLRGQTNAARQRLETVAPLDPRPALYLARLCTAEKRTAEAAAWARMATTNFPTAASKTTNDAPAMRIAAAQAHLMLREYEAAASLLAKGLESENRPTYRTLLAEVVAQWASSAPTPDERLAILRKGLPEAGSTPAARPLEWPNLAESARFLREWILLSRGTGEAALKARREIDRRLADPNQAPAWLTALGSDALERGDQLEARRLLVRAAELAPRNPAVLNNAAMLLSQAPDADSRKRALELIESALLLAPDHPEYRDTRGQVYLALERPAQALVDLEAVVDRVANPAASHRAIARAYRALGREVEAAHHEAAAQSAHLRSRGVPWENEAEP